MYNDISELCLRLETTWFKIFNNNYVLKTNQIQHALITIRVVDLLTCLSTYQFLHLRTLGKEPEKTLVLDSPSILSIIFIYTS